MLDRLHMDIVSIHGSMPRLTISGVPHYEAFWKDLLVAIEWIGPRGLPTLIREVGMEETSTHQVFTLLFSADTGRMLHAISVPIPLVPLFCGFLQSGNAGCLQAMRQICLFTYKVKSYENTKEQVELATSGFLNRNLACRELSLRRFDLKSRVDDDVGEALKLARLLVHTVTKGIDWLKIQPAHGSGAVSDSKRGRSKWLKLFGETCRNTDRLYSISEFFVPTPQWFIPSAASYAPSTAKLAIVPKDKRGPRVICTQPTGLMWIQQGQRSVLERAIETCSVLRHNRRLISDVSDASILFDNQSQNAALALESSRTREFATLDLKDASDLVSVGLVRFLFSKRDWDYLRCSRAQYVKVDGKSHWCHMFAPMGSAMCFPVESLVFWSLATAAALVNRGVNTRAINKYLAATKWLQLNLSEVFVFGDDIIVRREAADCVMSILEQCGLRPNRSKCFIEGLYRESCGLDAWSGVRLDIARLPVSRITSMSEAYAIIEFSNRARGLGLANLATYCECLVESYLGFGVPFGLTGGAFWSRGWPRTREGATAALSHNIRHNRAIRFNPDLQYWEGRTVLTRPLADNSGTTADGWIRLFRGLTTVVDEHTRDWLVPGQQVYHLGWAKLL